MAFWTRKTHLSDKLLNKFIRQVGFSVLLSRSFAPAHRGADLKRLIGGSPFNQVQKLFCRQISILIPGDGNRGKAHQRRGVAVVEPGNRNIARDLQAALLKRTYRTQGHVVVGAYQHLRQRIALQHQLGLLLLGLPVRQLSEHFQYG